MRKIRISACRTPSRSCSENSSNSGRFARRSGGSWSMACKCQCVPRRATRGGNDPPTPCCIACSAAPSTVAPTREGTLQYEDGEPRAGRRRKPREQWLALIPNAHQGYVSWEEFERIQQTMAENLRGPGHTGAATNGTALLAGLLRCRRCGKKLMVWYTGNAHNVLRYMCARGELDNGEPRCIAFGGVTVDAAMTKEILRIVPTCRGRGRGGRERICGASTRRGVARLEPRPGGGALRGAARSGNTTRPTPKTVWWLMNWSGGGTRPYNASTRSKRASINTSTGNDRSRHRRERSSRSSRPTWRRCGMARTRMCG